MKRKILFFIGSFEQGGAERQAAELIRGLDSSRYEAHLAVCNTDDQLGYALPVASRTDLRAPMGPEPKTLMRLVRLVRELQPDILHSTMNHQNLYGRLACKIAGRTKSIGSVRCTRLPWQTIRHEMLTSRLTDALIVNSRAIKEELVRRAWVKRESITVVENGVDAKRFRPLDEKERARERARFEMRQTAIVLPGRISSQKNQLSVIRALSMLRKQGRLPRDFQVLFAGRQEASTRYGTLLRAAIKLYSMSDSVRFLGVVKDVEKLVGAADAVLLPSHYEGLPNAVLESLACSTPAIVSPAANADELVVEGVHGIALKSASPEAIADGIARFIETTTARRALMGKQARAHVEARFTLSRMIDGTSAVYDRVLYESQ